ncbi:small heat shock protein-like protein [Mitosporidium daphniae]|uniref:Heat shock protein Hsp20 n=1 Tax=Mitosporidium daphniae TaxID=1485682 RepID=A0A098VYA9_9MICR|nr:heat shock protein Hsp20 [Mitosporidium daphniae]KGG52761.1 heat shock protein Hsp20 [Mitosporidium daphniae]|eukprot:XP_013239197.1 heat shock protein Hsp20 [Mitosporidium daphniae]
MNPFDRFFNTFFDDLETWWPTSSIYRPALTQGSQTAGPSRSLVPSAFSADFPLIRSSVGRIRTDFLEFPDHFEMTSELPGIPKDSVKITHEGSTLYLEAEKKSDKREEQENSIVTERSYGLYKRSFTVPENCNLDSGKASFEDGVLKIVFPKREPTAARKQIEL